MTRGRCGSLFLHRVTFHSLHLTGFAGAQGAEHDHYRSRLSPGLSANCVCGYRYWGVPGTATATPRGSGKVLSRSRRPGNAGACGDGSQWTGALVRTTGGRTAIRIVDRRCRGDPGEASTQAEDGSPRCAVDSAVDAGRSFSEDLGAEWGEPGSAATAMAPAPHGAGAHANHEPVASRGPQ